MNPFKNIQSDWQRQDHFEPTEKGAVRIIERVAGIRRKNRWTIGILSLTFVIVGVFFWHVGALNSLEYGLPVGLMLGSLFIRVLAELLGQAALRKIDPSQDAQAYSRMLRRFYMQRKWVHYVLTPLALGAYVWGFIILLPVFRAELSAGFYTYILISGFLLLMALLWLIIREVRREMRTLESLDSLDSF